MKKFLSVLLAMTMVLSLAACGGSKTETTTDTPAQEAEETTTAAETTASGDTIKIGFSPYVHTGK